MLILNYEFILYSLHKTTITKFINGLMNSVVVKILNLIIALFSNKHSKLFSTVKGPHLKSNRFPSIRCSTSLK